MSELKVISGRPAALRAALADRVAELRREDPLAPVTVFVGDGMSDRYAAACADVVFAKDTLAAFCDNASIPYTPFDTLAAVAEGIERLPGAGLRPLQSLSGKVSPAV